MKWHVESAYNPSDRGSSAGANHIVLEEPVQTGRLVRAVGDALCKPSKKFWGLTGRVHDRTVDCHHCARQAIRLGMVFDANLGLDVGVAWNAYLRIEGGRPTRVDLRNRWFRTPPAVAPSPPSETRLLDAVRAIAPDVQSVTITKMEPTGPGEVAGFADVT